MVWFGAIVINLYVKLVKPMNILCDLPCTHTVVRGSFSRGQAKEIDTPKLFVQSPLFVEYESDNVTFCPELAQSDIMALYHIDQKQLFETLTITEAFTRFTRVLSSFHLRY